MHQSLHYLFLRSLTIESINPHVPVPVPAPGGVGVVSRHSIEVVEACFASQKEFNQFMDVVSNLSKSSCLLLELKSCQPSPWTQISCAQVLNNLVDSNVFLRSLYLSMETISGLSVTVTADVASPSADIVSSSSSAPPLRISYLTHRSHSDGCMHILPTICANIEYIIITCCIQLGAVPTSPGVISSISCFHDYCRRHSSRRWSGMYSILSQSLTRITPIPSYPILRIIIYHTSYRHIPCLVSSYTILRINRM